MSDTQHDYTIENSSGSSVRTDIQAALQSLQSENAGSSEPTARLAVFTSWADTSNNIFKRRNLADNGWVSYREHDGTVLTPDGSAANPSIHPTSDTNTGLFSAGADQLAISCGGTARLTVSTTAITTTEPILFPDANASLPSITFGSDTDTGFYKSSANKIGAATNGVERVRVEDTLCVFKVHAELDNEKELRLYEATSNGSSFLAFKAPAALSGNQQFTLPSADGTDGAALTTNGSGALSFTTLNFVPIGAVMMWCTASVPSGWRECSGSSLARVGTYAALFAVIGTTFGAADSNHFNLPDMRGEFPRGYDHGRGVDSGRGLGHSQAQDWKSFNLKTEAVVGGGYLHEAYMGKDTSNYSPTGGNRLFTGHWEANDSAVMSLKWMNDEIRPRNVALMFIIKAV